MKKQTTPAIPVKDEQKYMVHNSRDISAMPCKGTFQECEQYIKDNQHNPFLSISPMPVKDERCYSELDIMTFYKHVKTHTFQEAIDHLNKSLNKPIPILKDEGYTKGVLYIGGQNTIRANNNEAETWQHETVFIYTGGNEANAARIVECWNNYDAVLAANKELLDVLTNLYHDVNFNHGVMPVSMRNTRQAAQEAIQKHSK